jgi:hypothetical protein
MKRIDKLLIALPIMIILICLMILQIASPVQSKALATDVVQGLRIETSSAPGAMVLEGMGSEEALPIAVTALEKAGKMGGINKNVLSLESAVNNQRLSSICLGAGIISANADGQSVQALFDRFSGFSNVINLFKQYFLNVFEPMGYAPDYLRIAF